MFGLVQIQDKVHIGYFLDPRVSVEFRFYSGFDQVSKIPEYFMYIKYIWIF